MTDKRTAPTPKKPFRLLAWWGVAVAVTAAFLMALSQIAPRVLDRDLQMSPKQLDLLATEKIRQANELKWVIPREQRKELMAKAVEYLAKANEIRPGSKHYQWYLCVTLFDYARLETPVHQGKIAEAIAIAERLWEESNGSFERAGHFLVDRYLESSQIEKARVTLNRLLEVDPSDAKAYDKLCTVEIEEGNLQEAVRVLNRKAAADNVHPSLANLRRLVDLHLALGSFGEAQAVLEKIILGGGGETLDWLHLGISAVAGSDWKDAISAFRVLNRALSRGDNWPSAASAGLDRYPSELFPPMAYAILESSLEVPAR